MQWTLDATHSEVEFAVRHLMISTVRGRFKKFTGSGTTDADGRLQSVRMEIDAASVDTNVEQRDGHLRSPDFFDVAKYPTITFESTRIVQHDTDITIEGNLTMRGVTRPITLRGEHTPPARDPWGNERAALAVTATINRKEWGLVWNQALETGGVVVSDEVKLRVEVEAVAAKPADREVAAASA